MIVGSTIGRNDILVSKGLLYIKTISIKTIKKLATSRY